MTNSPKGNSSEKDNNPDWMDWMNTADLHYKGNEWLGAVLFFLCRIDRKKSFSDFITPRYKTRNVLVGYAVALILFLSLMGAVLYFLWKE